jgi:hypothetical protein
VRPADLTPVGGARSHRGVHGYQPSTLVGIA